MAIGLTRDSMVSGHVRSDFLMNHSGRCGSPSLDGVERDDHDAFAALAFEFQGLGSDFGDQLAAFTARLTRGRDCLRGKSSAHYGAIDIENSY
jgi:hypothetical protein